MSRFKNALRKHYIHPYKEGEEAPKTEEGWLRLAKYISDITANNDEETEDNAWYHGDGTPETTVLSVSKGYDVEGHRFHGDEAQDLIDEMAFDETGRKVWHRVVQANGEKEFVGRATVSDIVTDGGPADEYETFSCTITFDEKPTFSDVDNGGDDGNSGE